MKEDFKLSDKQTNAVIDLALAEDLSDGDVTSEALIPPELGGTAVILAKAEGVLAGNEVARQVFLRADPTLEVKILTKDGASVKAGDIIAAISGKVTGILKAERVALNFLSHLSGIATATAQYVAETKGWGARIADTRKTTPGFRRLEKYAVLMGGGHNHRLHLGDGVLIKDNHIAALRALGMSLQDIVAEAKKNAPAGLAVEIEVNSADEALAAAAGGADVIMLDNISPDEMRRIKGLMPGHIKTEASGGITLKNVRAAAQARVDIISIGALTHSPLALDFSLELEPPSISRVNG